MTSACTLNSLKIAAKAEVLHYLYHLAKGAFQGSPIMLIVQSDSNNSGKSLKSLVFMHFI